MELSLQLSFSTFLPLLSVLLRLLRLLRPAFDSSARLSLNSSAARYSFTSRSIIASRRE